MVQPTTYYEVTCDHCGERLELDGVTAWESIDDAIDALNYCSWEHMDDTERVYCNQCIDRGEIIFGESNNEDDYE